MVQLQPKLCCTQQIQDAKNYAISQISGASRRSNAFYSVSSSGREKLNFESSLLVKCPGENERKKKTEKEKEALKRYLLS